MADYAIRMFEDGMGPSIQGSLDQRMIELPETDQLFEREDAISDAQHALTHYEYIEEWLSRLEGMIADNQQHRPDYVKELRAIMRYVRNHEIVVTPL